MVRQVPWPEQSFGHRATAHHIEMVWINHCRRSQQFVEENAYFVGKHCL
jgi:hypothetical protein